MSFRLKLICLAVVPGWLICASLSAPRAEAQTATIAAVVNGDVITSEDVNNRARFFALATGQAPSPDIVDRLKPQILQQLINERLEIQEAERRKIVVSDKEVAAAIGNIEKNNNMPPGGLRAKLKGLGVNIDTLIAQVRTQIGWNQVLRQVVGEMGRPTAADIDRQIALQKQNNGQPEYNVGEIFIPINSPQASAGAQKFADTVIAQLRQGAPFPIIAAQFSQGETALQGGALGWVGADQLDPAVAQLVSQMPVGAISNPMPVAGGITIVQLRGRQIAGQTDTGGLELNVRQVFLPFSSPLNTANPTAQQRATIQKIHAIAQSAKSCSDIEAANAAAGNVKPSNPGPVNLAQVTPPQFKDLLSKLPDGKASPPLIADSGVSLVMICGRTTQAQVQPSRDQVAEELFQSRVGLAAQQTLDELHRQGSIQIMQKS
ncbi:MAG TPA: peptidylprolyl isomerase [Acidisoma sp.]|jgi:peptidyl-prolyl cis-trans isomerase SurA|uniref:peptidylprolyl isomerase n=1 Tax=Acidisoma sp. TaxID=1872115 RepID=UPI002C4F5E66|nr:peptidylprolyl isomerase [Acidisoma sp.]HTI03080.1 peptidylprolyl isomerase [Acidisoma sp.]